MDSILGSTYRPFDLLVVDDRSTDDTAAIVERLAAADPRVRLIHGAPLPEGWYGKPWACAQGAERAAGALLLFTDADTRHEPELLGRAVAALQRERADLVTVSPHQRCVTFWERVVMPQIWLLLGMRYHPRRVNRARRERDVIANGQFILTSREAYEAVGTHAAVRHEVAEDLALAQTYFRHGRRLHFAFAERLMETRMYQSLPQLVEGWSKNIYLGGRRSFPGEPLLQALVPVMLALALGFWLAPPAVLLLAAAGRRPRLAGAAGARGDRVVDRVLDADIVWDADAGGLRTAVSPGRADDALHRGAVHLAGRAPGRVARAGLRERRPSALAARDPLGHDLLLRNAPPEYAACCVHPQVKLDAPDRHGE